MVCIGILINKLCLEIIQTVFTTVFVMKTLLNPSLYFKEGFNNDETPDSLSISESSLKTLKDLNSLNIKGSHVCVNACVCECVNYVINNQPQQ